MREIESSIEVLEKMLIGIENKEDEKALVFALKVLQRENQVSQIEGVFSLIELFRMAFTSFAYFIVEECNDNRFQITVFNAITGNYCLELTLKRMCDGRYVIEQYTFLK